MKIARSAARIGHLFGRMPGTLALVHGLALSGLVALAAWSPAANAIVVVSPASNLVVPATTAGIYINVVSGASGGPTTVGWDINPWGPVSLSFFSTAASGSTYVTSANSVTANLALGTLVGPASAYTLTGTTATTFGALAGQWALNTTNYFGFRFIGDDTLVHYGYGTMIMGATQAVRTVGQLWYESVAGVGITIPTATVVPEPSSAALLLIGAGAVGAVALRRRRQTQH